MSSHLVILGAGISGLAVGWFLRQSLGDKIRITILEKSNRAGGWIHTTNEKGFLFEHGPRSCRTSGNGRITLELIESLGLQDQVLIPDHQAKNRFIYDGNELRQIPKTLFEIPFRKLTKGWIKAFWKDLTSPISKDDDESIHAFFSRRFGKEWTDHLIDPFVQGIFAGDAEKLSIKSCFPLFHQWSKQKALFYVEPLDILLNVLNLHLFKKCNSFLYFLFKKGWRPSLGH